MTPEEAIIRIKDHIEIHRYHERNAVKIFEALDMAISALQAQEATHSSDTISRQAAIDTLLAWMWPIPINNQETIESDEMIFVRNILEALPSAQPERKTGRWLIREGISDAQCSECGMYFSDAYDMENSDAFCRHCGTKMEGLEVI